MIRRLCSSRITCCSYWRWSMRDTKNLMCIFDLEHIYLSPHMLTWASATSVMSSHTIGHRVYVNIMYIEHVWIRRYKKGSKRVGYAKASISSFRWLRCTYETVLAIVMNILKNSFVLRFISEYSLFFQEVLLRVVYGGWCYVQLSSWGSSVVKCGVWYDHIRP